MARAKGGWRKETGYMHIARAESVGPNAATKDIDIEVEQIEGMMILIHGVEYQKGGEVAGSEDIVQFTLDPEESDIDTDDNSVIYQDFTKFHQLTSGEAYIIQGKPVWFPQPIPYAARTLRVNFKSNSDYSGLTGSYAIYYTYEKADITELVALMRRR